MYWIIIILEGFFCWIVLYLTTYKYKPGSHKPNPLPILYPISRFHLILLPVCIYIYPSTCIPIFLFASISLYEQMYVHSANIDVVYCWGKIIYTMYVQFFSGCFCMQCYLPFLKCGNITDLSAVNCNLSSGKHMVI